MLSTTTIMNLRKEINPDEEEQNNLGVIREDSASLSSAVDHDMKEKEDEETLSLSKEEQQRRRRQKNRKMMIRAATGPRGVILPSSSSKNNKEEEDRNLLSTRKPARPTPAPILYALPKLPYAVDALEPVIDKATMEIHHLKHHATYVSKVNLALQGKPSVPIVDLMKDAVKAGPAIRNNGGGHYNHALFWDHMAPPAAANLTAPSAQLQALIDSSFGSMAAMKTQFEALAAPGTTFGSGWVWLVVTKSGDRLEIVNTPNQDNPLMRGVKDKISFPILGLDVWEHVSI